MRSDRLWAAVCFVGMVLSGCAGADAEGPGQVTSALDERGDRERIEVDSSDGLALHVGRDDVEIVLAAVSSDPDGLYRTSGLSQGRNSVLRSSLELVLDADGVPTGEVAAPGATIVCEDLGTFFEACLLAGDGSTISGLAIEGSGAFDAGRAVEVSGGTRATVHDVIARGFASGMVVLASAAGTNRAHFERVAILGSVIWGFAVFGDEPDEPPADFASVDVTLRDSRVEAGMFGGAGVSPEGGTGNRFDVRFTDNIVTIPSWTDAGGYRLVPEDSLNLSECFFLSEGIPLVDTRLTMRVSGGRVIGQGTGAGLSLDKFLQPGSCEETVFPTQGFNSGNHLDVEVQNVAFEDLGDVVRSWFDEASVPTGVDNVISLRMRGSRYVGPGPGTLNHYGFRGPDDDLVYEGSEAQFARSNDNMSTENVSGLFAK